MWFLIGFACGFMSFLVLFVILAIVMTAKMRRRKEAAEEMIERSNQLLEDSMIWAEMGEHDAAKEMFISGLKLSIDAQRLKNKDL